MEWFRVEQSKIANNLMWGLKASLGGTTRNVTP
jgi:hypothetical protein